MITTNTSSLRDAAINYCNEDFLFVRQTNIQIE
jgi:hypothetical protein